MEEKIAALAKEDETPWSRAHSNFANMSGFVIKFGTKSDLTTGDPSKPTPEPTSINLPHIHPNNNPSTSRRSDTVVDTEQHREEVGALGLRRDEAAIRSAEEDIPFPPHITQFLNSARAG